MKLRGRWRKRLLATAAAGTAVLAAGAYAYYWYYGQEEEEEPSQSHQQRSSRSSYDATSRALGAQQDAKANMQKHYDSIQKISDSTTLPQMLVELERGLDRAADVDLLIAELRQPGGVLKGLRPGAESKIGLWQELKLVSFARTLSATWLVGLLDLLLRVQLNILGRHLYMQQQRSSLQLGRRVTERAQEMFLEYAHYLPERATLRIVQQMQSLAATELASLDLKAPVDAASLVDRMSKVHAAFEEWAVEEGWAQLVLPTKQEAAEYFAKFRTPSSLNPDSSVVDEEVVQGMVDELHIVMKSVRFSAATISAVGEAARQVEEHIRSEVGTATLPLAKMVPKISAAGNRLLDAKVAGGPQWLQAVSSLPKVNELCASVYSCGPPP